MMGLSGTFHIAMLRLSMRLTLAPATELSWTADYRDEAANALHEILEGYLQPDYKRYTRVAPIIQSSGTGKSRMVDELGRRVVSIPLNVTTGSVYAWISLPVKRPLILFPCSGKWRIPASRRHGMDSRQLGSL